jgi:Flp pilus assembly pilin Flp
MLPNMLFMLRVALRDRRGVTAAEYAVLAVGIVGAVAAAAAAFGPRIAAVFTGILPATK